VQHGVEAGVNATTASNNIYIGNPGLAGESGVIRNGASSDFASVWSAAFVAGISSHVLTGGTVVVTSSEN
jgi:hypothetical protein